ncbi:MFS transporter [Halostagnicola sp. A-GB9-2]|uniref:MFS transporter n=1 Tax=Halostagnicola sp. A-GB9-2 TaxID=3048066 RepID=UPI0024BFB3DE|nr:MFS transporter [Halostagnicola sp. A-GB9-2]MDJ1431050.1 MFS transporter [Halostagnicola sp. A-GB9-2]
MNDPVTQRFRGRTAVFGSLCGLVFLVNLGRMIYAPLLEPFRTTFGASAGAVGLLATLVWVGSAAPRFPTGYILTKVPRRWVVLATGLILAGGSVFAALAPSLSILYVGALLMGIASGVYYVSAMPLVSELFPDRPGRAIGINGMASQLAAVAAPPLVAAVYAIAFLPIAAWRVIFLLMAVGAVISAFAFYLTARRVDLPGAGRTDLNLTEALFAQWKIILTGIAIVGLAGLVWNGVFNMYVVYLVESKGFSERISQILLTVVFATGVPAFWLTGVIADRISFVPLMLAVLIGFVICLVGLILAESLLAVFLISAVIGYVMHSLFPATDTYILASLPDSHRGSGYAVFSGTMMPIQAVGSVLVGGLVDIGFSFDEVFTGLAGGLVVLIVALIGLWLANLLPNGGSR